MTISQMVISLISAIISGVLATIITLIISHRRDDLEVKRRLVDDIFGYRYQLTNKNVSGGAACTEFIRALNRVPIVFYKNKEVMSKYDDYYNALQIADKNERDVKAKEALVSFMKALCRAARIKCDDWNDSRIMRTFS